MQQEISYFIYRDFSNSIVIFENHKVVKTF